MLHQYNTLILSVRKGPNKWRLIQDLHLINEAVVPLHPVVPNPYMILPPGTASYFVMNLQDVFFCIPLPLKANLSMTLRTPQESLDRSPGLSSPKD
jgi:hypothetical protein